MSKVLCDYCGTQFDTEDDADSLRETPTGDSFMCLDCRQEQASLDDPDWPDEEPSEPNKLLNHFLDGDEGDSDTKYKLARDNDTSN